MFCSPSAHTTRPARTHPAARTTRTARTTRSTQATVRSAIASRCARCALALGLLAVPAGANAQTKGKAKAARTVSFEDDVIEASYIRPEGGQIDVKAKNERPSLIRIRKNFFAELFRSAEDL